MTTAPRTVMCTLRRRGRKVPVCRHAASSEPLILNRQENARVTCVWAEAAALRSGAEAQTGLARPSVRRVFHL